ncbi:hypothetical protein LSCM1_03735 [Leishmania martiniquensis]|uniref:DREV methyltransferase n=1 Tax=Leishmania martiniquensis TaxID=1580590 RepID=A0A836GCE1_9TRYP|nr:hypothetical protein LSCM1_03735 [Leishmania martiniquensis]
MQALSKDLQLYTSGNRRRPPLLYEPRKDLLSPLLVQLFEECDCDAETRAFLVSTRSISVVKLMLANLLSVFVSRTTACGIAGRGAMFVYSTEQIRRLLRPPQAPLTSPLPPDFQFESLLDIGAGNGGVTSKVAFLFKKVYVTEFSLSMRWRLRRLGYEVLPHEDPFHMNTPDALLERRYFDVITCNNVLDRADRPRTMLKEMREALKPNGFLVLAVVLPWCPFVENGTRQKRPSEALPMEGGECCRGASFEQSLRKLVENVLLPMGFELVRWTRLPYLCEGSLRNEYAVLSDAVLILRKMDGFESPE